MLLFSKEEWFRKKFKLVLWSCLISFAIGSLSGYCYRWWYENRKGDIIQRQIEKWSSHQPKGK